MPDQKAGLSLKGNERVLSQNGVNEHRIVWSGELHLPTR